MFSIMFNLWKMVEDSIVEYIDVDFTLWLSWLLMPLLITFLLPLVIVALLYVTALILYIYKLHRVRLRNAYGTDWRNAARNVVGAIWDAHGWIWYGTCLYTSVMKIFKNVGSSRNIIFQDGGHDNCLTVCLINFIICTHILRYEVVGMENIPENKPVLFVYYHGAIPIDLYYFISKVLLLNSRLIHTVADRFLFKCPGWSIISDVLKVIPGTVQTCTSILKEGNMLAISPGGVYEAQFGDSYYELMWKKRVGFAKVALDAKVCIIPLFTKNVREAFRTVSWGRRVWLRIYAATRFPFVPIYGGFPVKLTTYVGTPIPYDASLTPEQLQLKVADALNNLIRRHQRIPGNISLALLDRIYNVEEKQS